MTSTKALTSSAVAIATAIIAVIVAAGLPMSPALTNSIITLITVVTPVCVGAFAWLHHNHAKIVAAREASQGSTRVNV